MTTFLSKVIKHWDRWFEY